LAPTGKQSSKSLVNWSVWRRIELDDDEIETHGRTLGAPPRRFEEYALRDPQICVAYVRQIMKLNLQITGNANIPPTLSSVGINLLLRLWKEGGWMHMPSWEPKSSPRRNGRPV